MINLTIELQGVEAVQNAFRDFTLREQRSVLLPIFKNAAKPTVTEMKRMAPVSKKNAFVSRHRDYRKKEFTWKEVTHRPGELKRSIRITQAKKSPTIFIGPTGGSDKANDAFYWRFVSTGHPIVIKGRDGKKRTFGRTKANDYINRAWTNTRGGVVTSITNQIEAHLKQRLS